MEHLSLEIFDRESTGSKYAILSEDASITITDTSEIFGEGDVWSYPFTLNIPANVHIFGSSGEMHGSRLHEQINKRRARIWVDGIPLYLGYLLLSEEVDVDEDGNVDVSFESGKKTFDEMVEGAKANQVPMMGDVLIGMALWRKRWTKTRVKMTAYCHGQGRLVYSGYVKKQNDDQWFEFVCDGEEEGSCIQEYPRIVIPKGVFRDYWNSATEGINCINTDYPYTESEYGMPEHPYCNIALCYQKYGYEKKDSLGTTIIDYSSEPEAARGYEYMPAIRTNSAPNFFVIYWIRALMKHLGITVSENQMMDMEDLRRLFFVNTNCSYEEPKKLRTAPEGTKYGRYLFNSSERIIPEYISPERNVNIAESGLKGVNAHFSNVAGAYIEDFGNVAVALKVTEVDDWTEQEIEEYKEHNSYFHKAYATSDCFPSADISEVINALKNGFGIRLVFDRDYQRVRIVLLRNVFRSSDVQNIDCDIISCVKTEGCIRGFRMTYGNSEDTHFYYKGFNDMLPHKTELWKDTSDTHDYSHWNLDADYSKLIHKVSAFDKTCYVEKSTGNAFGIKVDKDAKRYEDLHPSLFEFAGFMDAEDGDCTGDEETIETINVGFTPSIMNDVNFEVERDEGSTEQRFALFVDEKMRPRRPDLNDIPSESQPDVKTYNDPDAIYDVNGKLYDGTFNGMMSDNIVKPGEFAVMSDMYAQASGVKATLLGNVIGFTSVDVTMDIEGHVNEGYRLYLQDNYEPNDNGVSPIETHDWGLMLGIMRGSGSDAYVRYSFDPDDNEGNDTWDLIPGSSATSHPDTCDSYGKEWSYNTTSHVSTSQEAIDKLNELFPDSNAPFHVNGFDGGYINKANILTIPDDTGKSHLVLIAIQRGSYLIDFGENYIPTQLVFKSVSEMKANDAAGANIIIEIDSTYERRDLLLELCKKAWGNSNKEIILDGGIGSRQGRFSLKLRAEKPNPDFDSSQAESINNRRYLEITDENLKGRGLCDTFYKEYSYFIRNARTAREEVRMELAQFLAIDMTKRTKIGDITGFVKKMQFTVSNKTGMGNVTMEMKYI